MSLAHLSRNAVLIFLCLLPLCMVVGCTVEEPFEFAPWTMPVPEGTRLLGYDPVSTEERERERDRIELVEDLVIEEEGQDFNYLFGSRTPRVAPDAGGNIYVVDTSNKRVQVFDSGGLYVRTMGRSGQGPGEFDHPMAIAITPESILISDSASSRLSKWGLDGLLYWDKQLQVFPGYIVSPAQGLSDGSFLMRFRPPREPIEVVMLIDSEGEEVTRFGDHLVPERVAYTPFNTRGLLMFYAGRTPPMFTASPDGDVYLSTYDEYQVFAYTQTGEMRWALQVPWPRPPLAREEKEWGAALMRSQRFPETRVSDIEWPESQFALCDVKVDGHGRVYVFPYVPRGTEPEEIPVDVYSRDGKSLFHGFLRSNNLPDLIWQGTWKFGPLLDVAWHTASGDYIYGVVLNDETGARKVVRHRLVTPFGGTR